MPGGGGVAQKISRGLTLRDGVMGQVRAWPHFDTDLTQKNQGVDSVQSLEGRKERRMDKNVHKMNKSPIKIRMVGRQEREQMKKHSGSLLMDHADESGCSAETKESERERKAHGPAFTRLGEEHKSSLLPCMNDGQHAMCLALLTPTFLNSRIFS